MPAQHCPTRLPAASLLQHQPVLPRQPVVGLDLRRSPDRCYLYELLFRLHQCQSLSPYVIYTNYCSDFTSVNHSLLLHKLHYSYNLSGSALGWFEFYQCGREQCVVLNGKTSGWVPVVSGVPKGSICGPFLFVLFCNDVPSYLSSTCLLYANDLKLCKQIRSPDDAVALQTYLQKHCSWLDDWKLKLNPTKCKVITFSLRKKKHSGVIPHQRRHLRSCIWDARSGCHPRLKINIWFSHRRRCRESESRARDLPALTTDISCCHRS